jgi:hypothetical protein
MTSNSAEIVQHVQEDFQVLVAYVTGTEAERLYRGVAPVPAAADPKRCTVGVVLCHLRGGGGRTCLGPRTMNTWPGASRLEPESSKAPLGVWQKIA